MKQFAILIDSCFLYVSLHVVCIPMRMYFVFRYFIITFTVFQCDFDGRLGRTISRFIACSALCFAQHQDPDNKFRHFKSESSLRVSSIACLGIIMCSFTSMALPFRTS
jgi:hypothetical protein